MKREDLEAKLKIYTWVVVGLLGILGLRLAVVQIFQTNVYQTRANENRMRLVAIKAPRGEIYASGGKKEVLAANQLVYTVSLSYQGVQNQDKVVKRLSDLVSKYYPEVTPDFIKSKIESQKFRLFQPVTIMRDIPWELVVKLEENRQDLPGVDVNVEPLRYYPQGSIAGHVLGYINSINQQELTKAGEDKYSIDSLIGKSGVEKEYEEELRGKDGAKRVEVDASGRPVRDLITLNPTPGDNLYLTIDMKLQKVMEQSMESTLKSLQASYPKARVGSAVLMNVKTGEILAMCSSPSLNPNDFRGHLDSSLSDYYFPQGQYNPLSPGAATNRAIQSSYPPGSTFKAITGMSAMEKGKMNPVTSFVDCTGKSAIPPHIKCTGVHGEVNYFSAMAKSCNVYFQEMGYRAGIDEIDNVAQQFGLGSKTGIDLPEESSGLLPTPAWKKKVNSIIVNQKYDALRKELADKYNPLIDNAASADERAQYQKEYKDAKANLEANYKRDYKWDTNWQTYDTLNMSIGQGFNDYTVLQLADYVSTIANGGKLMKPYVVSKITSPAGKVLKQTRPQVVRTVNVSQNTLAQTREAMLHVTQSGGTASFLFSNFPSNIKVGAKTGTAETGRQGDNPKKEWHGVFIAFAPFDNPEIAFAGVVEYGFSGGTSAGLVAKAVFEQYFGIVDHLAGEANSATTSSSAAKTNSEGTTANR